MTIFTSAKIVIVFEISLMYFPVFQAVYAKYFHYRYL
jgi:hypothetical protein